MERGETQVVALGLHYRACGRGGGTTADDPKNLQEFRCEMRDGGRRRNCLEKQQRPEGLFVRLFHGASGAKLRLMSTSPPATCGSFT